MTQTTKLPGTRFQLGPDFSVSPTGRVDFAYRVEPVGGSGDDTANVQAAANKAAGKSLVFPAGETFRFSSEVTLPAGVRVIAHGATLQATTHTGIFATSGDGVSIEGGEYVGAWASDYDTDGKLITAIGADNGSAVAPGYISGFKVVDAEFRNAGRCAVYVQYVSDFAIERNTIENVGYAGVEVLSSKDGRVMHNRVTNVTPGSSSNGYGVYLSQINSSDTVRHPVCERVWVDYNRVIDSFWEGLDCHGGRDLSFSHNVVEDCRAGIAIIHADDENDDALSGAQNVRVIGNTIRNGTASSSEMSGIVVSQGETHRNIVIAENVIDDIGNPAVSTVAAGILVGNVEGASITGNAISNCAHYGVFVRSLASNVAITGNTFQSIVSDAVSSSAVIRIARDAGADGPVIVSGNTLLASDGANTYKDQYGISASSGDEGNIRVGVNHFAAATVYPYNLAFAKTNGSSFPVTNFGIATIAVTTSVSSASLAVTLTNPHSLTSLMAASASINSASGNTRTLCHVVINSTTQITINVYSASGSNFAASANVLVNWQTMGF